MKGIKRGGLGYKNHALGRCGYIAEDDYSTLRTLTNRALFDAGFKLSIDDFGTGYSSLSYLKRFPIQKVKIDRSFIADIEHDGDSKAITTAIVQMDHSLGLQVLAEGVENEAQLQFLQAEQCDFVQGYYSGRPMPAAEFIECFGFIGINS